MSKIMHFCYTCLIIPAEALIWKCDYTHEYIPLHTSAHRSLMSIHIAALYQVNITLMSNINNLWQHYSKVAYIWT